MKSTGNSMRLKPKPTGPVGSSRIGQPAKGKNNRMPSPPGSQMGAPGQMNKTKRTKGGYSK